MHRRETVEKERFHSCPEKKRENRTKPRFCTVYSYGAPWRKNGFVRFSLRRVEPHRSKNRSTGYRAESHRTIYHSTEPHRSMSYFSTTHRTIYITAPHRTVGFTISENRTERHLKMSAFLKTVPNRTVRFSISENRTVYGRITVNNPGN